MSGICNWRELNFLMASR